MSANNKFGMLLAVIVLAMYALAGCEKTPAPVVEEVPHPGTPDNPATKAYPPVLYVDNETGCHYLATAAAQVLTPRLRADGTQVCGGAK